MDQPPPEQPPAGGRGLGRTILFIGALGVTGTAAWLYLRARQKQADAQTRDRLQPPHGGTGA